MESLAALHRVENPAGIGKAGNPGKGVFLQEFMQDLPREMTAATVPIPAYVVWS
jgi:hypothetical protein